MSKDKNSLLNSEQRLAVEHTTGPLLIVAGAGTGKTTVITERIKWLIGTNLAKPEEILALTFTEKAAKEMETRVDEALPYGTFGLWISTFHSFCDRVLRNEALNIGLDSSFRLTSDAERFMFVKKNFWKFELNQFRPRGNPFKFIEGMLSHFDRLKDEDISISDYEGFAKKCGEGELGDKYRELAAAFKTYEELKEKEGLMDFSDLIANTLRLFRDRKVILESYQKQFKYILVDEFQDTNYAQNEMLKLLAGKTKNITVVADDDQSIYRFRGAAVSNVIQFRKTFENTKVVTLVKNYRSSQEILDRSYDLITKNNPDRLEIQEKIDKKLIASGSNKKFAEEKVEMIYVDRVEDEAEKVVSKILELKKKHKLDYKDFAILVRANNHSEPFIRSLERTRVPYQFLGPGQLFRQPEVKDLIAYLKFLADFTDSTSLYRVLSMDIFDISQRELIELLNKAKLQNVSLFELMETSSKDNVKRLVEMIHRNQELVKKETAGQILFFFLEDSGLITDLVKNETQSEEKKAQNISKFFDKLKAFETANEDASVFAVVDYLDLAMEMGESPLAAEVDWSQNDAINILTIHSAKGLEFPVVFLVNLIEGRFPSRERKEQIPIPDELIKEILPVGDFHTQEERRLFYVGMTRAKEHLIFSAANFYGEGKRERKLSPFVIEAVGEQEFKKDISAKNQLPLFEWKKEPELKSEPKEAFKVEHLSYSAIETFKTCPLHYKLKYIGNLPTVQTASQSLGNSIHLALRDFYENKDSDILGSLKRNWIKEGYASTAHEEESLKKAKVFLTDYLKSDLHKNGKPIILEQSFVIKLDSLKVLGKIDRIDDLGNGEIEIIDYKTGANIPTQREIDLDLQMGIYALAATDKGILNRKIDKVKMSFYFFDTGSKITTTRKIEDLEKIKTRILEVRDEIEKSDFECSKGVFCQNCEYKILCSC